MPVMRQSAQQRWTADNPDRPSSSARVEGRGAGARVGEGATLSQSVPGSAAARATSRLSSKIAEVYKL